MERVGIRRVACHFNLTYCMNIYTSRRSPLYLLHVAVVVFGTDVSNLVSVAEN